MWLALFSWLVKWKWAILGTAASAVALTLYVHINNDAQRKADLAACKNDRGTLEQTILGRDATIVLLNAKVGRLNGRIIELVEASNARVAAAEAAAVEARLRRDEITSELAQARFDLEEAFRNDVDYANWAVDAVPAVSWVSLRKAASGTD